MDIQKFENEDDSEWEDVDDEKGDSNDDYDFVGLLLDEDCMFVFGKIYRVIVDYLFWSEEIKSCFMEYLMIFLVMRRNEQLILYDERFEKFYE